VLYAEIVGGISPEDKNVRREVDSTLGTATWPVPRYDRRSQPKSVEVAEVPDGAPAWWHGDEEASQLFLREMGVS